MNTPIQKTSKSGGKSLFFQDLASPISTHRGKFANPGQAAAVSALWRENFGGTDPPPPPVFTLEDRVDFSPESGVMDYRMSTDSNSEMKTPFRDASRDSLTPVKGKFEASTPSAVMGGRKFQQSPSSSSWWSPGKSGSEQDKKGKGSPVDSVVNPGVLITLPPRREVARPELQRNSLPAGNLDEEEWVTVYGFTPGDTNAVLREFEKCGPILKYVSGPGNANWMHILYQYRFDAQKALSKNGMQINGILIVGVKSLDPIERQTLNEGTNNHGFMTFAPQSSRSTELIPSKSYPHPNFLQNNSQSSQRSTGVIASPAKSVVSKVMDLMFGI